MHTWAVGRRRGARGVGLLGGGLFIPWRPCGGSQGMCVHGHTSCVCFMVFHGFPVFSCGALPFGGSLPLDAFTHLDLACLMASSSYACGGCKRACLFVGGGLAVVSFPSCVAHLGSLSSCRSVAHRIAYNILVSAAGMFTWRLPYVVSLFCFSYWCLGRAQVPYSYCMHFAM